MRTTIIIPCYNEEKRLNIDRYMQVVEEHHYISLLFVNDGSKDGTLAMLNKFAEQSDSIQVLDMPHNVGKAEAVRCGILHAVNDVAISPDFVAFYDADMATPFGDMVKMIEMMEQQSLLMITGCRIRRLGANIERHWKRWFTGRIFATCVSYVLKLPIYDTQCGAKIFRVDVAKDIFVTPFISKWIFDVELFARTILKFGYEATRNKTVEYPLSAWYEVAGSKITFNDLLRQPINIIKIARFYKLKKYKKTLSKKSI
jgi:glycosyltransferase involved in cell wall biosynthesis